MTSKELLFWCQWKGLQKYPSSTVILTKQQSFAFFQNTYMDCIPHCYWIWTEPFIKIDLHSSSASTLSTSSFRRISNDRAGLWRCFEDASLWFGRLWCSTWRMVGVVHYLHKTDCSRGDWDDVMPSMNPWIQLHYVISEGRDWCWNTATLSSSINITVTRRSWVEGGKGLVTRANETIWNSHVRMIHELMMCACLLDLLKDNSGAVS